MYNASSAFHEAVANRAEQKAMLIFPDCIFTNEDISVENGIEFRDYFNLEEDMSIGQATSNEISFSLFNDARLLNNYTFGDFEALLGVKIGTTAYTHSVTVTMTTGSATYIGRNSSPYLTRGTTAVSSQPNFAVKSMLAYNNEVWVFGANNAFKVYNDSTGAVISGKTLNDFMKAKVAKWNGVGYYYNKTTHLLDIFQGGIRTRFEFVPLGSFTAERPKSPDVIQIDMNCNDFMMKFEKDMPSDAELGITYPITFGNLMVKLCQYVGVSYVSSTFINSTATVDRRLDDFNSATMRDVIKWIAEAAACNARFDRDGRLKMDWLRETVQEYGPGNYTEFLPCYYTTKQVTKLVNRSTQSGSDLTVGNGTEEYLIQDNPLLKGVS